MKKIIISILGISLIAIIIFLVISMVDRNNEEVEDATQELVIEQNEEERTEEVELEREDENGTVIHVDIIDYTYSPSEVTVNVGDTVTWTNRDNVRHDVVGDGIESPLFPRGESFSYTFTEAGTYNYICSIHPYMTGTVIVEE